MTRTFNYKATRDIISTTIGSVLALIGFFIMNAIFNSGILDDVSDSQIGIPICKWLYFFSMLLIITCCVFSIYAHTFTRLVIRPNEIVYRTGWISKKTVSIPSNKIRSCSKSCGILQHACDTMTIAITTAGDSAEIRFCNLENGEEAFQIICEIAQRNQYY